MPKSINGCGTMYCGYSAPIYWTKPGVLSTKQAEHDAVVCITVLMLPIFPLRTCHVYDHTGNVCREIPLRWRQDLTLRALLRPWLFVAIGIGLLIAPMFVIAVIMYFVDPTPSQRVGGAAILWGFAVVFSIASLLPLGLFGQWCLNRRDQRSRDIRLILGRHALGSSDPATWSPEILNSASYDSLFPGTSDFAKAARDALKAQDFTKAMLAARLAVAKGQDLDGEEITDRILADQQIDCFLEQLRHEPWRRSEWLDKPISNTTQTASDNTPPKLQCYLTKKDVDTTSGALFYDSRVYSNEVLDAVGGAGFAEFVRTNPLLVRAAPEHWLPQIAKGSMALMCLAVAVVSIFGPAQPDKWSAVFGGALMAAVFGWLFWQGWTQRISLGGGRLWVGTTRGQETLIDAVTKVGRRRWIGLFPIVSAKTVASEINWPCHGRAVGEIEHALEAAIKLRAAAVKDQAAVGIMPNRRET